MTTDIAIPGGRVLRAYDAGGPGLPVFWMHGSPNIGTPPEPLYADADRLGLRWAGYDRPGYGGSTPVQDRDVASAAADVAQVADALGIGRFAVLGHSGGGAHALACAALLPERVTAVAAISGLAPFGAEGLDWYAGFAPVGAAAMRAARAGRDTRAALAEDGDIGFGPDDWAALEGDWAWFGTVVSAALATDTGGAVEDDLAHVRPWGFDPEAITRPVLLMHGGRDRTVPAAHSEWLAAHIPGAELRHHPGDGHITVMRRAPEVLEWLAARA